jgi:L-alanine-DL-glutamate epimerase-like enolase superfamily enzyme
MFAAQQPERGQWSSVAMTTHLAHRSQTWLFAGWGAEIMKTLVSTTCGDANVQYFYRGRYEPKDGYFQLPAGPGFGYELDEGRSTSRVELP